MAQQEDELLLQPGTNMGTIHVERFLRSKGEIQIYNGVDRNGGENLIIAAIKKLDEPTTDALQRFQYEVEALSRMNNDNIIKVVKTGSHNDINYAIYEGYSKSSLKDYLQNSSISPLMVKSIVLTVSEAVYYFHEFGLVHGHLSGVDFYLTPAGVFKLVELGVASDNAASEVQVSNNSMAQTITQEQEGMSSNVIEDPTPSFRMDIKALGHLLVEVITAGTSELCTNEDPDQKVDATKIFPNWSQRVYPNALLAEIIQLIENDAMNSPQHLKQFLSSVKDLNYTDYTKRVFEATGGKYILTHLILTKKNIANLDFCIQNLVNQNLDPAAISFVLQIAMSIHAKKKAGLLKKPNLAVTHTLAEETLSEAIEVFKKVGGESAAAAKVAAKKESREQNMDQSGPVRANNTGKIPKKKNGRRKKKGKPAYKSPRLIRFKPRGFAWIFKYLLFIGVGVASPFLIAPFLPDGNWFEFSPGEIIKVANQKVVSTEADKQYNFSQLPQPVMSSGSYYVYRSMVLNRNQQVIREKRETYKVVKSMPDYSYYFEDKDKNIIHRHVITALPPVAVYNSQRVVTFQSRTQGSLEQFYPLHRGKNFNVNIFEVDRGEKSYYSYACNVIGSKKVLVPAGSFWTLLIECKKEGDSNIRQFYYSPRVQANVIEQVVKANAKDQALNRKELVSYRSHKN